MRCLRRRFPWSSDSLRERYFGLEQQVPNSSEFVTGDAGTGGAALSAQKSLMYVICWLKLW